MRTSILLLTIALFFSINQVFSQETVTLTVTGQGNTTEEAKLSAFRSAIEQAFGTFISSNTTILNDELIKDEITSISNGNIQNFEILSEVLQNGEYHSTIEVTVSVLKLTSFCETKGVEVEFKGGLFASNIKMQNFYSNQELLSVNNMIKILELISKNSFDYNLQVNEPTETKNSVYKIPFIVTVKTNENFKNIENVLFTSLKSISIPTEELANYKKNGKKVYFIHLRIKNELYEIANSYFSEITQNKKMWLYAKDNSKKDTLNEWIKSGGPKDEKTFNKNVISKIGKEKFEKINDIYQNEYNNIQAQFESDRNLLFEQKYYEILYNKFTSVEDIFLRNQESIRLISWFVNDLNLSIFNFVIENNIAKIYGADLIDRYVTNTNYVFSSAESDGQSKYKNIQFLSESAFDSRNDFESNNRNQNRHFDESGKNSLIFQYPKAEEIWLCLSNLENKIHISKIGGNKYNKLNWDFTGLACIKFEDLKTLVEIEKITKYEIKSRM